MVISVALAVWGSYATTPMPAPDNQPNIVPELPAIEIQVETIEDITKRILNEYRPITREIGLQIVEVESHFQNVCNADGCEYGIGPAQIVQSTFDEQCKGNINNVSDNLWCMAQLIDKEEYWRWEQSMDKWLYKLSPKTRDYVKVRCECMSYARSQGINIPLGTDINTIKSNSPPTIGGLAIFSYDGIGHVAIITGFRDDGFTVKESNFEKCKISERFAKWDDEKWNSIRKGATILRGFYK